MGLAYFWWQQYIKCSYNYAIAIPCHTHTHTPCQLVLAKTQEKAASSLTEVTWLGQKVPVRSEKVRVSLVRLQQVEGELVSGGDKMEVYERLLMECQDALQVTREELSSEQVGRDNSDI